MRAFVIALPAIAVLAACMTPAERAAQEEREVERMVQTYGPACTKLGFSENTDPWRSCIISLSRKDDAAYYHRHAYSGPYGPAYWRHPYWGYW